MNNKFLLTVLGEMLVQIIFSLDPVIDSVKVDFFRSFGRSSFCTGSVLNGL